MKSTKPTDLRSDRSRPRKSHTKQNRKAVTFWHQGLGVIMVPRAGDVSVAAVPFRNETTCRKVAADAQERVTEYRKRRAKGLVFEPLLLIVEPCQDFWIYREETT